MKKKRIIEANSMTGYDLEGNLIEYHWQKEPYRVRRAAFSSLKLPWYKRFNPFWGKKIINFEQFAEKINSL